MASLFCEGILVEFSAGGDRIEVVICHWAGELDRTAHSPPVANLNNTVINEQTQRRRLERQGGGVASSFCEWILVKIFGGEGRIDVAICDRAGEFDCTAWSPTSTTPQSMSVCVGGGWNGRGMAWHLRFVSGFWSIFLEGGWGG